MSLTTDLKILYHLTLAPVRGLSHAERLESFYQGQAVDYDRFRKHLLQGREQMLRALPLAEGKLWVDMGAGTGSNLEFVSECVPRLQKIYLVDLSHSLMSIAKRRVQEHGWKNVDAVLADATRFAPSEGNADVVSFSYSLSMIPDWFAAIDRAWEMLPSGGTIGVADFYVSRKYPGEGRAKHSWMTRSFWQTWFGFDNVYPSADHIPYLQRKFTTLVLAEGRAKVKYFPGARVPYYWFVGRKDS